MSEMESRIAALEARNARVEADKAWEGSWVRRGVIMVITYVCAFSFMKLVGLEPAVLGACVPVGGYVLSTLGLRWVRKVAGR